MALRFKLCAENTKRQMKHWTVRHMLYVGGKKSGMEITMKGSIKCWEINERTREKGWKREEKGEGKSIYPSLSNMKLWPIKQTKRGLEKKGNMSFQEKEIISRKIQIKLTALSITETIQRYCLLKARRALLLTHRANTLLPLIYRYIIQTGHKSTLRSHKHDHPPR